MGPAAAPAVIAVVVRGAFFWAVKAKIDDSFTFSRRRSIKVTTVSRFWGAVLGCEAKLDDSFTSSRCRSVKVTTVSRFLGPDRGTSKSFLGNLTLQR